MRLETLWKFVVNTNKRPIAEKFLEKVTNLFDGIAGEGHIEPYWKIENTFMVSFKKEHVPGSTLQDVLALAALISQKWSMNLPMSLDNNLDAVFGVANENFKFAEVSWANFDIHPVEDNLFN